jgi:alpha-L-fucosidase 2
VTKSIKTNLKIKYRICFFLFIFLAGLIVSCQQDSKAIDLEKFFKRHDLVWNPLKSFSDRAGKKAGNPKYHRGWDEGAFIGNGMIGAMIYKEDAKTLRFELGRNDVTARYHVSVMDWSVPRVPIGDMLLTTSGNIEYETMRLDIWNAEAHGEIKTDKGIVNWRTVSFSERDIIAIIIESSGDENGVIEFRPKWGISPRFEYRPEVLDEAKLPPKPVLIKKGDINLSIQELTEKGNYTVAWKEKPLTSNKKVVYINVSNSYPEKNSQGMAVSEIENVSIEDLPNLIEQHRNWWHGYYKKSFLSFSDPKWESFYWIQIYKLASATRSDGTVIDNQGPWLTNTPWAGTWWNLNVQLSYSSVYAANRLSIGESLYKNLYNNVETLKQNVPDSIKVDGLESIYMGRASSVDLKSHFGLREVGNMTWALHSVWRHYRYSMNEELLLEVLYPLLKMDINFYLSIINLEKDNKYHLPATHSPEYAPSRNQGLDKWDTTRDANYALALLKWGLEVLVNTSYKYKIEESMYDSWKDILENLVDYQIDENGFMVGKDLPFNMSHRHYSHLVAFFPLYLINPDQPEHHELINKSINHWISFTGVLQGYSYTGASSMEASMGRGNKALEYLDSLSAYLQPNTMYCEAGPVIETPLSAAESIHNMILQSWGGKIRVFPAVPDRWQDITFSDLRTEGAFLVSASRKNGHTEFVKIKSLAGEPCVVKVDFTNEPAFKGSTTNNFKKINENLYQIDLKKDEEIVISAKNYKGDFTISPIETDAKKHNLFGSRENQILKSGFTTANASVTID